MTRWLWLPNSRGDVLVIYVGFVGFLFSIGRREGARALAGFIPDCAVLVSRLLRDPRAPRRRKLLLVALLGYLSSPLDLVPDFIPVVGQLDDVIIWPQSVSPEEQGTSLVVSRVAGFVESAALPLGGEVGSPSCRRVRGASTVFLMPRVGEEAAGRDIGATGGAPEETHLALADNVRP
jgi:hypothetical protein